MAIYRTKKGASQKVSSREIKKTIMKANDWTEAQYKKQYDIFKNKLRAYESYKGAHLGMTREEVKAKQQSPQELLYKVAKAKLKYGSEYEPTLQIKRIESFSAESITKGWQKAQEFESAYSRKRAETFGQTTQAAFADLIAKVPRAAEIDEQIKDPVQKEEALKALAEFIKAKQKGNGELFADGETYGSDEIAEGFDFSYWL